MKHSHSICVLREDNDGALYGKVSAYLSEGYSVVYAVESSTKDTIQRMNDAGIKAENYIDNNALTVLDRNAVYSQTNTNNFECRLLLERWGQIISQVVNQNGKNNFRGIAVMGMPEPFFETAMNHQKLVEYEHLASKGLDSNIEAICCYTQRSVASLPLRHLVSLLNAHQNTLVGVEEYDEWAPTNVLDMLSMGLEKALGKTTSKPVFEAIRSVHNIDERIVVSQPEILESAIQKIFSDSASTILDAIKGEIITNILFGQRRGYYYSKSGSVDLLKMTPPSLNSLLCPSCYWSATAMVNWKPEFCPVCHHSPVRSTPLNFAKAAE